MNITIATQNVIYDRLFNLKPHNVANISRLKYFKMCRFIRRSFCREKVHVEKMRNNKNGSHFGIPQVFIA